MRRTFPFALAALGAAALLAAATFPGGAWAVAALLWLVCFAVATPGEWTEAGPKAGGWLPVVLGVIHFPLLFGCVLALSRSSGAEAAAIFVASGLYFGQVSNPVAHELIHSRDRLAFLTGQWIYASILFGHHSSAHRLVHHVHVATPNDPNTARKGESLYRFLPRAWIGSFRLGLAAERDRGRALVYVAYVLGGAAAVVLSAALAGWAGAIWHLLLAGWASIQLLTSDYVQHYGLCRMTVGGKPEPVGPRHSWDMQAGAARWLMLNAPLHASHHIHPGRSYQELSAEGAPQLPYPLAVMGALAFLPRTWRRIMDPRLERVLSEK